MAYDEELAHRMRKAMPSGLAITEKRMMGGVCFFLEGNMVGGADRSKSGERRLMFRVGKADEVAARLLGGLPMFLPERIARANAKRSAVRSALEHVFAGQKHRMGLVARTIGIARARIKIGMANLAYNFQRLAWLEGRTAPA